MEIKNILLSHLEADFGCRFTPSSRKILSYISSEKKIVLESSLCTGVATFLIFNENVYLSKKKEKRKGIICSHRSLNGW